MSLKAFHILFVTVSFLLCVGFGVWAVRQYLADGGFVYLVAGLLSLALCVVLLVYGRWFLNKHKGVSYL